MNEGFGLHEMIFDDEGRPCDYRFLDVNPAFEQLTGLKRKDILGRTVFEVLPGNEPLWIETFGRVVQTGEPAHVEQYSTPLGRWYEVFAYRPAENQFACVFLDVSVHAQAEERARKEHREAAFANRVLRAFVECEGNELFDRALAVVQEEMASTHGVFGYIAEPGHLVCPSMSKMLNSCEVEGKCIHYPLEKWKGLWARADGEAILLYQRSAAGAARASDHSQQSRRAHRVSRRGHRTAECGQQRRRLRRR